RAGSYPHLTPTLSAHKGGEGEIWALEPGFRFRGMTAQGSDLSHFFLRWALSELDYRTKNPPGQRGRPGGLLIGASNSRMLHGRAIRGRLTREGPQRLRSAHVVRRGEIFSCGPAHFFRRARHAAAIAV